MWIVSSGLLVVGLVAFAVMWQIAEHLPDSDRGKAQIDAIKYGLGIVAAAGAAVALLVSVRRQQLSEYSHRLELRRQEHTEKDAAARHVTDLYTKAVEQLGSADAAVRLGGLYALERVAQENPPQRQTIVDVICAYLRMPYAEPDRSRTSAASELPLTELPMARPAPAADDSRGALQELQVRLTAQRLLATHLRWRADDERSQPQPEGFWSDIDLDLTGARLIDWNLDFCRLRKGAFRNATFTGRVSSLSVRFTHTADFSGALFASSVEFAGARFFHDAIFEGASFAGTAGFSGAVFGGHAVFRGTLTGVAVFMVATFTGNAIFQSASTYRIALDHAMVTPRDSREDAWPQGWRLARDEPTIYPNHWGLIYEPPTEQVNRTRSQPSEMNERRRDRVEE
ncbi:pentapeptide repeat-containing protein [Paractinoplanes rishiriensis]|uniref:Pentapeptide repeat-containing protein n=1 Tax=Paractinoplanes rishiriensis TaxID=1050105 RepID=A0A919KAV8_9ACTN|nr:pentapeptide repeat-containing protein [Actinoplanes rishiriensis]GIF01968.1 hypothetical protein Ari01nite_94320 [Actinoplanes rishiriensis]